MMPALGSLDAIPGQQGHLCCYDGGIAQDPRRGLLQLPDRPRDGFYAEPEAFTRQKGNWVAVLGTQIGIFSPILSKVRYTGKTRRVHKWQTCRALQRI